MRLVFTVCFLYLKISFWSLSAINTFSHYAVINSDSKKKTLKKGRRHFCLVSLVIGLTFFSDKSGHNRQIPVCKGDNPNIKYETFEPKCIRTFVFVPSTFNLFNYGTFAELLLLKICRFFSRTLVLILTEI